MQYLANQIVAHAKCMFTLKSGWAPLNVELRNQQLVTCVTMGAIVGTNYLYCKRDKQIDGKLALGAACGGLFGFACSVTWPAALVFVGTYVFCEGPKVFQKREKMTSYYCGWASCNGKCGKNIRPNL